MSIERLTQVYLKGWPLNWCTCVYVVWWVCGTCEQLDGTFCHEPCTATPTPVVTIQHTNNPDQGGLNAPSGSTAARDQHHSHMSLTSVLQCLTLLVGSSDL